MEIILPAIVLVFMLVGLLGLIVPLFPGIAIIWLAGLAYGLLHGFSTLGLALFVLFTLLALVGTTIDNVLMGAGARKGGASWLAVIAAFIAGIAGTLLLPPIGGLIATPLAVMVVEYLRVRDWKKAFDAMKGLTIGWGLSFLAAIGIGVVMIIIWAIWAWKG